MAMLTIIWWRDIPAQVTAHEGPHHNRQVLHPRFQMAIDKAAARAGKGSYDDYVEEWRRVQVPCSDDVDAEVAAEAARLETVYTKHRLAELILSGGVDRGPVLAPTHDASSTE